MAILSSPAETAFMSRHTLWRALGGALFALGLAGLAFPLLPTTVFWILAVLALQKSDPALAARIRAWPKIGPAVSDFLDHGVISTQGKLAALSAMAVSALLLGWLTPNGPLLWTSLAGLAAAGLFVATRRSRPRAPRAPAQRMNTGMDTGTDSGAGGAPPK